MGRVQKEFGDQGWGLIVSACPSYKQDAFLALAGNGHRFDPRRVLAWILGVSAFAEQRDDMWSLAVVIPIACCVLIPAGIALAAYLGFGRKNKPVSASRENEVLPAPPNGQESPGYLTWWRQRRK